MLEFFQEIHWAAIGQIIVIDILLGGDNAIIIALACRNLQKAQRLKGILWGTVGAITMRVVLIMFAMEMLKIPFLRLIGGALLIWIGIKLLIPEEDHGEGIQASSSVWGAVKTILIADFVMSLDNVIAIAGAAGNAHVDHQTAYVIFGLLVSVPIIIWGSTIVLKIIDKFPLVILFGAGLLGWLAGGMFVGDVYIQNTFFGGAESAATVKYTAEIGCALFVMIVGKLIASRKAAEASEKAE
ncbi:TerC family protein [Advenella sp. RU8]|uniref:TerC family protein n=1 Tax=Advenella sp. RU8 TaxID=3399575 RepID=UPI003AAB7616